jgi:hypothetical protein
MSGRLASALTKIAACLLAIAVYYFSIPSSTVVKVIISKI